MQENDIIERIKALCEARSWTCYRLAKESGITYSTLCTMIHKANTPSIPTLLKICKGFGITPAEFFDVESPRASLSTEAVKHLHLWEQLNESEEINVEKYINFLLEHQ